MFVCGVYWCILQAVLLCSSVRRLYQSLPRVPSEALEDLQAVCVCVREVSTDRRGWKCIAQMI